MTLRILAMVEIICYNAVRQNVKGCQQEKWEKMTLRILAMVEIICYNAVRQNVKGVHGDTKNENPGGCDSGVFYSILGGWLMP